MYTLSWNEFYLDLSYQYIYTVYCSGNAVFKNRNDGSVVEKCNAVFTGDSWHNWFIFVQLSSLALALYLCLLVPTIIYRTSSKLTVKESTENLGNGDSWVGICAKYRVLGSGTHLFVKVSRPGDSEGTFSVFESSCHLLLPV